MQDACKLEDEHECVVELSVVLDSQWPHVNVGFSVPLLKTLKTRGKGREEQIENELRREEHIVKGRKEEGEGGGRKGEEGEEGKGRKGRGGKEGEGRKGRDQEEMERRRFLRFKGGYIWLVGNSLSHDADILPHCDSILR